MAMYSTPPASPAEKIGMMCGWSTAAAARDSRMNRRRNASSCANRGARIFSATSRSRRAARGREEAAMPPKPICASTWYPATSAPAGRSAGRSRRGWSCSLTLAPRPGSRGGQGARPVGAVGQAGAAGDRLGRAGEVALAVDLVERPDELDLGGAVPGRPRVGPGAPGDRVGHLVGVRAVAGAGLLELRERALAVLQVQHVGAEGQVRAGD